MSQRAVSVPVSGAGVSPEQDANAKSVNAQRAAMMIFFMDLISFIGDFVFMIFYCYSNFNISIHN